MAFELNNFVESVGLYTPVEITRKEIFENFENKNNINIYCNECRDFRIYSGMRVDQIVFHEGSNMTLVSPNKTNSRINYECAMNNSHRFTMLITLMEKDDKLFILKTGQYPSYTDITRPQLKKYNKLLGTYYNELTKAVGLFDSGIGIGSYAYLRRIIENLVKEASLKAIEDGKITEKDFDCRTTGDGKEIRNTVVEKIKLLSGYLPSILIDNANCYSIVSKGIHELSEKECMDYFPILEAGIRLVLDDLLEQQNREKEEHSFTQAVAKITGLHKNK